MNHHKPGVRQQLAMQLLRKMYPNRAHFVARPCVKNLGPCDWPKIACSFCGQECYQMPIEPDPLPEGFEAACSECSVTAGTIYGRSGNSLSREEVLKRLREQRSFVKN